jgi:predicted transcriptional regulator
MTEHLPLYEVAIGDRRLRGLDLRVLFRLCQDLDAKTPRWVKYDAVAEPLSTSRGNVYNAMSRLREFGYLVRVERSGVGGRGLWRLPVPPAAAVAKFHR